MLILSYDIASDKLRTKFSQYIKQYGAMLQYSVYEIRNSDRVLNLVQTEIKSRFESQFSPSDSVMIFQMSKNCKKTFYGYAKHLDSDLIIL